MMMMRALLCCCLWLVALGAVTAAANEEDKNGGGTNEEQEVSYGLDVSFPIHHRVSTNYPWLPHNRDPTLPTPTEYENAPLQILGDRQSLFTKHLEDCRAHYADAKTTCDVYEYDRMTMNLRQPQSMKNYTETGFKKIRAPEKVVQLIKKFWNQNSYKGKVEQWGEGNPYVNVWDNPTYLISVDDKGLRGSGRELKEALWAAASATLEEWVEEELQPVSLYGIRVYGEGAVMLPHVDRLPLVASAIINVYQDVDEDWPTEVYDHSGRAHNITMHAGDMLLFESHSVIHGHPFPLKGRSYASIFMHFEPTGHSLLHNESGYYRDEEVRKSSSSNSRSGRSKRSEIDRQYRESVNKGVGGQSATQNGLPPYVQRESPEEKNWRNQHPEGWKPPFPVLPPEAHIAAMAGKIEALESELDNNKEEVLTARDEHGWQVLHQGVAGGNKEVVELLVNRGAEVNARTHGGYGETPLRIAEKRLGKLHPIVEYLKSVGALSIGPEL